MAWEITEISQYRVSIGSYTNVPFIAVFDNGGRQFASLIFTSTPVAPRRTEDGLIAASFAIDRFHPMLDVLRHERPVRLMVLPRQGSATELIQVSVSTLNEPVGEDEPR
jgi:hypothetical protein